jgi:cyclophilin family peptidyl-prolyl cis-trans isomerase
MSYRTQPTGSTRNPSETPVTRTTLVIAAVVFAGTLTAAPVPKAIKGSDRVVVVETSLGDIEIELYPDKAPKSVTNFLGYVDDGFYDGLVVHRVIPEFMIQGGGFEPGMKQKKTKDPIPCEADNGLSNTRGAVAMARTQVADSATSQFFINLADNKFLDRDRSPDKVGYCVFGKVVAGTDVVDAIAKVKTGPNGGHSNVPVEDVVIKSVRRKR